MLAFRNYLRSHPKRAAEYGELKRNLARQHRHDNVGYMRGKDVFIKVLINEANAWAASNSP